MGFVTGYFLSRGAASSTELSHAQIAAIGAAAAAATRGGGDLIFDPVVHDVSGSPIAGAAITVRRQAGSVLYTRGITDSLGRVKFGELHGFVLAEGDYVVTVQASGFAPFAPQALTLPGVASPVYELESLPPLPVSPFPEEATVKFEGYAFGVSGAGVKLVFKIVAEQAIYVEGRLLLDKTKTVATDENAEALTTLIPSSRLGGAKYQLTVGEARQATPLFEVPDEGGVIHQLIQASP